MALPRNRRLLSSMSLDELHREYAWCESVAADPMLEFFDACALAGRMRAIEWVITRNEHENHRA